LNSIKHALRERAEIGSKILTRCAVLKPVMLNPVRGLPPVLLASTIIDEESSFYRAIEAWLITEWRSAHFDPVFPNPTTFFINEGRVIQWHLSVDTLSF
jgi:hypothetical protein